jgi:DNA (cytosine-5)-methyltransferase 1
MAYKTSAKPKVTVKAVSLFSGCGGTDFALKKAGYSIVWANDIWDKACDTYRDNIPEAMIECDDIKRIESFPKADLLVGCYPCQGYTQGGKRDWEAPINYLYIEFERALKLVNPKAFIVENVIGMTFGANKVVLNDQLSRYGSNYRVKYAVLNARDFGVPQNRRRVLIVGIRNDIPFEYDFPTPTHGPGRKKPFKTQRDALSGLPMNPPAKNYNIEPLHWYYLSRRRRCDWDEPSPCVVGHWRHVPLHPMSPPLRRVGTDEWRFEYDGPTRRLSFRECAALQGFPRSFKWKRGNVRDKFQMIGNAVPPPLFAAVLKPLGGLWGSAEAV